MAVDWAIDGCQWFTIVDDIDDNTTNSTTTTPHERGVDGSTGKKPRSRNPGRGKLLKGEYLGVN